MQLILTELKKTNSSIDSMADRINSIENGLKSVERNQSEASTPSSSSSVEAANKRKVSARVRVSNIVVI